MHNYHGSGHSFPMTKISTDDTADRRASMQQVGEGQLAPDVLRLLVAAMID